MNLAIQDAGILGTVAVPALSRSADDDELDRALEAYEAVGRPINRRAMNLAHVLAIVERPTRPCYLMSRVALLGLSRFPQMLGGVANHFRRGR